MFAVAHPLDGSRWLARFEQGLLVEWTDSRGAASWYSERKDARAVYRGAWLAAAALRRTRLETSRNAERAARDAFAQRAKIEAEESDQNGQKSSKTVLPDAHPEFDHHGETLRDAQALIEELERIEQERDAADAHAQDGWLDGGSEAILFEKPDSLLRTPGFVLYGFMDENGHWASHEPDGEPRFSDSGERIALFQSRESALQWGRRTFIERERVALVSLRSEMTDLRPLLSPNQPVTQGWIKDVLTALEGEVVREVPRKRRPRELHSNKAGNPQSPAKAINNRPEKSIKSIGAKVVGPKSA